MIYRKGNARESTETFAAGRSQMSLSFIFLSENLILFSMEAFLNNSKGMQFKGKNGKRRKG